MNLQRRGFILVATLAAAVVTLAVGQAVVPAAERADDGPRDAASVPDFSGVWTHPYFPGFEPPASGAGPIVNKSRLRGGPQERGGCRRRAEDSGGRSRREPPKRQAKRSRPCGPRQSHVHPRAPSLSRFSG